MAVDFQAGKKIHYKRLLEHGPFAYLCTFSPVDGGDDRMVRMVVELDDLVDGEYSHVVVDRARVSCLRDEDDADVGGVDEWLQGDSVLFPAALDPQQKPFVFSGEVIERFGHRSVAILVRKRQGTRSRG